MRRIVTLTTTRERLPRGRAPPRSCVSTPDDSLRWTDSTGGIIERQKGTLLSRTNTTVSQTPSTAADCQSADQVAEIESTSNVLGKQGDGLLISVDGGNLVAEPVDMNALEAERATHDEDRKGT